MTDHNPHGWEPDPRKMGNWRAMFEQPRRDAQPPGSPEPPPAAFDDAAMDSGGGDFDPQEYRPWILQRGRSRPSMMLGLRRFDARAGLWQGWGLPYPSLYAVEYMGDRMLNLDFGSRQFVIEGHGLMELARCIKQGTVAVIQEYAAPIWPHQPQGPVVTAIRRIGHGQPSA